jgi:hypothetical protein
VTEVLRTLLGAHPVVAKEKVGGNEGGPNTGPFQKCPKQTKQNSKNEMVSNRMTKMI